MLKAIELRLYKKLLAKFLPLLLRSIYLSNESREELKTLISEFSNMMNALGDDEANILDRKGILKEMINIIELFTPVFESSPNVFVQEGEADIWKPLRSRNKSLYFRQYYSEAH
jgi:hypothetical protein